MPIFYLSESSINDYQKIRSLNEYKDNKNIFNEYIKLCENNLKSIKGIEYIEKDTWDIENDCITIFTSKNLKNHLKIIKIIDEKLEKCKDTMNKKYSLYSFNFKNKTGDYNENNNYYCDLYQFYMDIKK